VTKDNVIIAGNGTVTAAKELGWETIDITRSQLTGEDATAFGLVDNRSSELAAWDDDNLKEILGELDKSGWDIEGLGWDSDDLKDILDKYSESGSGSDDEDAYTKKIKAPVYEPTGPKPEVKELFDTKKSDELIKKIDASDLHKKEKDFLKYAAYRHVVFNYQNIAEYYAHSDKPAQELFEDSALVIIDFNKAIENGFVKLSQEIAEAYADENG
jgi:hypothetical protein